VILDEKSVTLPDLLTELQNRTHLTRRSIAKVLIDSGRLQDFKRNPQQFIDIATSAINRSKRLAVVQGVKYRVIGDEHFYSQELIETNELTGYVRNLIDVKKAAYHKVVFDSNIERNFAEDLENDGEVRAYVKLPGWFTIPTPLGTYNPDWAIALRNEAGDGLYFVVETKGSNVEDMLRDTEAAKVQCGKVHFNTIAIKESPAKYQIARTWDDVLSTFPTGS